MSRTATADWSDDEDDVPTKEDLDFIVADESDEEGEEVVVEYEEGEEVDELLKGLSPEERALLSTVGKDDVGPRRSSRKRKAPERYVDDKYLDLMLNKSGKVDLDELAELDKEDEDAIYIEDSDGEFVVADDADEESESDDDDEEEGGDERE